MLKLVDFFFILMFRRFKKFLSVRRVARVPSRIGKAWMGGVQIGVLFDDVIYEHSLVVFEEANAMMDVIQICPASPVVS